MYYRIQKIIDNIPPSLQALIFVIPTFTLGSLPPILLFCSADKLGYWWTILLILYIAIIIAVAGIILYFREIRALRIILGDELFFKKFPREKKRYIRKLRREEKRKLRKQNIKM